MRRALALGAAAGVVGVASAPATAARAPTLSLDSRDQARARHLAVEPSDLGRGWKLDRTFHFVAALGAPCAGFDPDLSALVVKGRSAARVALALGPLEERDVVTAAFVFASAPQARQIQERAARPYASKCLRPGGPKGGPVILSVTKLSPAAGSADEVEWRVQLRSSSAPKLTFVDYVFLRTGSYWVSVTLVSTSHPFPAALERRVLRAVAGRMAA